MLQNALDFQCEGARMYGSGTEFADFSQSIEDLSKFC